MPRIDQSPESAFTNIDDFIRLQGEVNAILDKFYAFKSSRVSDIESLCIAFHDTVKREPELYDLLNASFVQSNKFQTWVKSLTPDLQEKVTMGLKEDPESHRYMIHLGANDPIQTEKSDDGFDTTDYMIRTQSHWLKNQLNTESNENKIEAAKQIEAFVRDERICVSKSAILRALLTQYLYESHVDTKDKATINACFALLDKHKEAYQNLNLHNILNPASQTLDEVILGFSTKYQSSAYVAYHQAIENLIPVISKVIALGDKYPSLPSSAVIMNAASAITTRPEQCAHSLNKLAGLIEPSTLSTADNRLATFNGFKEVNELLYGKKLGSTQRKEAALCAILSSESLKLDYPDTTDQAIHHRSAYLETLLTEAFPTVFKKNNGLFEVHHTNSFAIYKALGLMEDLNTSIIRNSTPLNPTKFNVSELNTLHEGDKSNPLWPMLLMIKPVDNRFTIKDKIDGYIKVIQLISGGQLKLNNTPPLEQTRILAKELLDLVNTPINKSFTIEQQIQAHLEVIQLIKKTQLQIDDKPAIKQAEEIAKSALEAVDRHGVYSPRITQLFTDIKKETDPSLLSRATHKIAKTVTGENSALLAQDQQSVQRQLRMFLEGKRESTKTPSSSDTDSMDSDTDQPSNKG